eukprot:CAMPEP_0181323946 /NCGR_PEP_ID=MMETSP1101-20121128/20075_1 /TAXON_ID=46948 /ORGANISM="Rhodomonas abbreviata, Strain Caron Lab Isolate" /LENGTH=80 /DNA_ID=CAMNT_0023432045 /DNA_START=394 /DNA_END=633 /DNA_ORIENTATION=+
MDVEYLDEGVKSQKPRKSQAQSFRETSTNGYNSKAAERSLQKSGSEPPNSKMAWGAPPNEEASQAGRRGRSTSVKKMEKS